MTEAIDFMIMSLEEAWNIFKLEANNTSKEYKEARFGINIKFDINDYIEGHIRIKSKSGKVFIRGTVKQSEDFYTELEEREKVIKEWLIDNYTDGNPYEPRRRRK